MEIINNKIEIETPKKRVQDFTKEEKAAYMKACNLRYREKHREKFNASCLNYYHNNIKSDPDKMKRISEQKKEYYVNNKEKKDAYSKKYMKNLLVCQKKLRELEFLIMV